MSISWYILDLLFNNTEVEVCGKGKEIEHQSNEIDSVEYFLIPWMPANRPTPNIGQSDTRIHTEAQIQYV